MTSAEAKQFDLGGDMRVHRLGFGAMRLTGWGPPADPTASLAVARRAVELGVTLIDTADSYGLGANEELLAEALYPYPDDLVIATKSGQSRPGPEAWVPLGRPEYLRQQVELSLRRLRVECLDVFQLHRIDPVVAFEDQIGALDELRRVGKVRHVGLSEVTVDQLDAARAITDIATVQNQYNIVDRDHDAVVDYCDRHQIAFLAWKPLNYANLAQPDSALSTIADQHTASDVQVALAWLLARSPVVIPIPGTTSIRHLEQNWMAATIELSESDIDFLDQRD